MKKFIYLFLALLIVACGDDDSSESADCNCIKTSYHSYFPTGSSNYRITDTIGTENVVCQDEQGVKVFTIQTPEADNYYYVICCDNFEGDPENPWCN